MKMLRKIIGSKSLENSKENIMMEFDLVEFDLVKLQVCSQNNVTLL